MRHANSGRKFKRTASHRNAMFRNLATSFFTYGRLETTLHKAKELRPIVEKMISKNRTPSLTSKKAAFSYLMTKYSAHRLFTDVGPKYISRPGGYTRITRTRVRAGDTAAMAVLELV